MPRLPKSGGDNNVWGTILNDFLLVSHTGDGSLRTSAIQQAGGITTINGKSSLSNGNVSLTASDVGAAQLDSTATDIQPDTTTGTAAAGSTGKAADAGHRHALVSHDHTTSTKGGQIPIAGLSATGTPSSSTYLRGDGTWGTPNGGSSSLANDTDVIISGPTNNELLTYNTADSKWVNAPAVNSFNGRTGLVAPQGGDYTAAQVGALASTDDVSAIATANPTAGDVSMNSHKLTDLANGTLATDAATLGQIPVAGSGITDTSGTWSVAGTSNATNSTPGLIQLSGDLGGSATAPTVESIQGVSISGTPDSGQFLQASSSAAATWVGLDPTALPVPNAIYPGVRALPNGDLMVYPFTFFSGSGDDGAAINAASALLPSALDNDTSTTYSVGRIWLAPYTFNIATQIVKPPKVDLIGSGPGTILSASGSFPTGVISTHHPAVGGTHEHQTKSGIIANLAIDGTNATGASIGIDVGDGWGHRIEHVWISNFTGSGAIGLSVCNRNFWTEKFYARHVNLINNSTGAMHWTNNNADSHEYQDVSYFIWATNNSSTGTSQNGVTFQGVKWNGKFALEGNIGTLTSGTNWMVGLFSDPNSGTTNFGQPSNVVAECCINYEVNIMNLSSGSSNPNSFYFGPAINGGGTSTFQGGGLIRSAGGGSGTGGGSSNAGTGQFQFRGFISESNSSLQAITTPTLTSASPVQNTQNDAMVYLSAGSSGGTITAIVIQNVSNNVTLPLPPAGISTAYSCFVPANGTITVTFTGSISWKWAAAL